MVGQGPEIGNLEAPQAAVVELTPRKYDPEASEMRPFYTPEGYDVHDPNDAAAYLINEHGRDLPQIRGELDAATGFHLAMAMAQEKRAATYTDGSRQNVAEHSFNVAFTSIWVALAERSDLDAGKVAIMATNHDPIVEAYGGDTVITDLEAMASKPYREAAGMTLFLDDAGDSPIGRVMREYEIGDSPEARFVNGMDKVEAYQFALANKAALHRERGERFEEIVVQALPKAVIDPTAFENMQYVLKQLGRKWEEWGCVPIKGDPDAIVNNVADILANNVVPLHAPYPSRVPQDMLREAVVLDFPERDAGDEEPAEAAGYAGSLAVMDEWRRNGSDRPDPTPPDHPNVAALIA